MKNCLIFITAGFPYGSTEPFIESELPFCADFFDKIIFFSLDAVGTSVRQLPQNAESFSVSPKNKRLSRLCDVLHAAFRAPRFSDEFPKDKKSAALSIKRRLFLKYFETRSERHFKEIVKVMENMDFSGYDNIVIYSYWFFVTAMTGILLKEYLGKSYDNVRLVSRGHRYDIYSFANSLDYLPGRNRLFSGIDMLYVCSEHGKNYLSANYPRWSHKIRRSYLGTLDHGPGAVADDGIFRIVSCSRVVPVKRLDRIAESLALLKDSGIRLSWTHIGTGPDLRTLKRKTDKLLRFMEVNFIGALSNKSVLELYSHRPFDVFINVSGNEGLPVSIMEAASFGIPSIATDVCGTGEIVLNGKTGVLIPADFQNNLLAAAIKDFALISRGEYIALRHNARKNWEENFRAKDNYSQFAQEISGG